MGMQAKLSLYSRKEDTEMPKPFSVLEEDPEARFADVIASLEDYAETGSTIDHGVVMGLLVRIDAQTQLTQTDLNRVVKACCIGIGTQSKPGPALQYVSVMHWALEVSVGRHGL